MNCLDFIFAYVSSLEKHGIVSSSEGRIEPRIRLSPVEAYTLISWCRISVEVHSETLPGSTTLREVHSQQLEKSIGLGLFHSDS